MDEYERIAERLCTLFIGLPAERETVKAELDKLNRADALVVVVMMTNRMRASYREQFAGYLACFAMGSIPE